VADLRLELYIVGRSRHSLIALANLQRLCETEHFGDYELEVIDVLEHPEAAEAANILATPTLVKRAPTPVRRIVGDLSQTQAVLKCLDIHDPTTTEGETGTP
jgi:circadian clock protein KaiB